MTNETAPLEAIGDAQEKIQQERLNQLVADFDFDFLRAKFRNLMTKCGKPPESAEILTAENIINVKRKTAGIYYRGKIGINMEHLLAENLDPKDQERYFEHALIHEEVHAVTDEGAYVGFAGPDFTGFYSHELWNEGVTEKLAQEIVAEYFIAKGNSAHEDKLINSYEIPRRFVDLVIDRISEKTGVSKSTVWEAIIRAMFVEHVLDFSEAKDIVPQEFWHKLAWATGKNMTKGFTDFDEKKTYRDFKGYTDSQKKPEQAGSIDKLASWVMRKLKLKK